MTSEDAVRKVREAIAIIDRGDRSNRSYLEQFRKEMDAQAVHFGWYSDSRFCAIFTDFEKALRNF